MWTEIETYKGFIVEKRPSAVPTKRWNAHRIMEIAFFAPTRSEVLTEVDRYLRENALVELDPASDID